MLVQIGNKVVRKLRVWLVPPHSHRARVAKGLLRHIVRSCPPALISSINRITRPNIEYFVDIPPLASSWHAAFSVMGWAVSHSGIIAHVWVFLDGKLLGEAAYGSDRSDVVSAHLHLTNSMCGYTGTFVIDEANHSSDFRELMIKFEDSVHNTTEHKRPIRIVRGEPGVVFDTYHDIQVDVENLLTRLNKEIAASTTV